VTLKSDRWIRRMAKTGGVIESFEPQQIKQTDGHELVSYGTSRHGYGQVGVTLPTI
jgi:dCTP deaminase